MSSCLPLPKTLHQLLPSSTTKAWTSFTSSLHQPKLRRLARHLKNLPKSFTTTARHHLHPSKRHRTSTFIPRRKPRTSSGAHLSYYKYQYQYQHLQQPYSSGGPNSPAATVYVDRLFGDHHHHQPSSSTSSSSQAEAGAAAVSGGGGGGGERRRRRKKLEEQEKNNINNNNNNGVKWKEYVSKLPAIRGVDERAEEFISKFRHQMELQREQSLIDFHQMLARTT